MPSELKRLDIFRAAGSFVVANIFVMPVFAATVNIGPLPSNVSNVGYESITMALANNSVTPVDYQLMDIPGGGDNITNGAWVRTWSNTAGDSQLWTFIGNGDGTFVVHPMLRPDLCLTNASGTGHATINNCTGNSNQSFFAQRTGNWVNFGDLTPGTGVAGGGREFTMLIRSVATPSACLNAKGQFTDNYTQVLWYPCQQEYWANQNDRWVMTRGNPVRAGDGTDASQYNSTEYRIFSQWADLYALTRGTGSTSALTLNSQWSGTGPATGNPTTITNSPFTTITLNSSSTPATYKQTGGVLLPFYNNNVQNLIPYINNTTGSSMTVGITSSVSNTNTFSFGFKQGVSYSVEYKTSIPEINQLTHTFGFTAEASQDITKSQTSTNTVIYQSTIPNNESFWIALGTSGSLSSTNAIWDVYNDVGDHSTTDPMTSNITFGSTTGGISYCGSGSADVACTSTKPKGTL